MFKVSCADFCHDSAIGKAFLLRTSAIQTSLLALGLASVQASLIALAAPKVQRSKFKVQCSMFNVQSFLRSFEEDGEEDGYDGSIGGEYIPRGLPAGNDFL